MLSVFRKDIFVFVDIHKGDGIGGLSGIEWSIPLMLVVLVVSSFVVDDVLSFVMEKDEEEEEVDEYLSISNDPYILNWVHALFIVVSCDIYQVKSGMIKTILCTKWRLYQI